MAGSAWSTRGVCTHWDLSVALVMHSCSGSYLEDVSVSQGSRLQQEDLLTLVQASYAALEPEDLQFVKENVIKASEDVKKQEKYMVVAEMKHN